MRMLIRVLQTVDVIVYKVVECRKFLFNFFLSINRLSIIANPFLVVASNWLGRQGSIPDMYHHRSIRNCLVFFRNNLVSTFKLILRRTRDVAFTCCAVKDRLSYYQWMSLFLYEKHLLSTCVGPVYIGHSNVNRSLICHWFAIMRWWWWCNRRIFWFSETFQHNW